ncbi:putative exported protein [Halobacteriovorax marinus SJ]|uniref:Exported protein n=1 Tax=Halobacteriovorax marinus (strain ATCC BAA-682 / DSM 15412 / SJ) TaxID=862908 RepID=E1X4Y7_HALMS|nr:hypothetical protein [Halobacteriovorax marinus]CBW27213.1 putative exported protein [Halobacteriovorax marinus SJ]
MNLKLLILFILTFSSALASDGEYTCGSVQGFNFNTLSQKVLGVSYQIDKVKELKNSGLRSSALNLVQEGMSKVQSISEEYRSYEFCYSFSKRAQHKIDLLAKYKIELALLQKELKEFDDCTFAIMKLEEESKSISEESSFYEKFTQTSKTLTKAELIRRDYSCNQVQKEKLSHFLIEKNLLLSKLYKDSKNS